MNIHERMESIADLHAAGGLSADERSEADQHAASCAACAALLRDAKEFAAWARGAIAPDAPPADLEARLIARFRESGPSKRRRFIVGKRFLKAVASVAAAVGLIFIGNAFGGRTAASALKTLSSAEADFRANDRDWNGLNWANNSDFAHYFGRDLGVQEVDKIQKGLASLEFKHSELARDKKVLEDKLNAVAQGGERGAGFGGKLAAAERQVELEKLEKLQDRETNANRGLKRLAEADGAKESLKLTNEVQETRKIIRTADVSLEVESYDATYTKLAELIAAEKGQISAASTQKLANGKIRATVTIRILPERFEAVIGRFKEFGTVRNQTLGSEDVTKAYIDLETRLKSKLILAERLSKLLSEGKGTVKELMDVEVQLGATNEAIEQLKGEIKYYDNRVGMSTITLRISEKDLGQPFEYVQTLQSSIAITGRDPDDVYAKAQKEIVDAGGQVVDSKMTRQSDGSSMGTIKARVDSEKFPALREVLKRLGTVTNDVVNQQKSGRGGSEGAPKADAPLRKEQAVIDLLITSPPLFVTKRSQLLIETAQVETAYQSARRVVEAAGGKIIDGSLTGRVDGMSATLKAQVDAEKFNDLLTSLKTAGEVKNANVNHTLPPDGMVTLLRERAEIELALVSPPKLIGEQHGILKTIRDTFANSWAGLLWSIEKLFVGISLAGPWIAVLAVAWILWRRSRRKKAATPAA